MINYDIPMRPNIKRKSRDKIKNYFPKINIYHERPKRPLRFLIEAQKRIKVQKAHIYKMKL